MAYTITTSLPDPKGTVETSYTSKNFTKDQFVVTKKTANETVYSATAASLDVPCTIRISRESVANVYNNIDAKINAKNRLANTQGTQVLCQINDFMTFTPDNSTECCDNVQLYAPIKSNFVFRIPNASGITADVLKSRIVGQLNTMAAAIANTEGQVLLNWAKGSLYLPFDQ